MEGSFLRDIEGTIPARLSERSRPTTYRSVHKTLNESGEGRGTIYTEGAAILTNGRHWRNRLSDFDNYLDRVGQAYGQDAADLELLKEALETHSYFNRAEAGNSLREERDRLVTKIETLQAGDQIADCFTHSRKTHTADDPISWQLQERYSPARKTISGTARKAAAALIGLSTILGITKTAYAPVHDDLENTTVRLAAVDEPQYTIEVPDTTSVQKHTSTLFSSEPRAAVAHFSVADLSDMPPHTLTHVPNTIARTRTEEINSHRDWLINTFKDEVPDIENTLTDYTQPNTKTIIETDNSHYITNKRPVEKVKTRTEEITEYRDNLVRIMQKWAPEVNWETELTSWN